MFAVFGGADTTVLTVVGSQGFDYLAVYAVDLLCFYPGFLCADACRSVSPDVCVHTPSSDEPSHDIESYGDYEEDVDDFEDHWIHLKLSIDVLVVEIEED